MPKHSPSSVRPELDHAVHDLLRAEVEFARAYAEWAAAPPARQRARRAELDARERRIAGAMREAQRWQAPEGDADGDRHVNG